MKHLAGLPLLSSLDLSGCDVRALNLEALSKLSDLRELSLAGCYGMPADELFVLTKFRGLRRLDVRGLVDVATGVKLAAQLEHCDVAY